MFLSIFSLVQLSLSVSCHLHSQILHRLCAFDAVDFTDVLFREDLRLLLVKSEIPSLLQRHQLVDDHRQLILIVGHHQHVVGERQ